MSELITRADAFEEVAKWHDTQARFCLEASKDDPRLSADDRRRAFDAYRHHAGSAASIRAKMVGERRAFIDKASAVIIAQHGEALKRLSDTPGEAR